MDAFKIVGLGLTAAVLAVFIKNTRPEFAIQISLIATVLIVFFVMPYFKVVVLMMQDISDKAGISLKYIKLVFKVVGIGYITQFGAEICRDAGQSAIASKIEFGGKVIIMFLSMPVIYSLIEIINQIMYF